VDARRDGAEILVQMDADLSHDPAALPALLDELLRPGLAFVAEANH